MDKVTRKPEEKVSLGSESDHYSLENEHSERSYDSERDIDVQSRKSSTADNESYVSFSDKESDEGSRFLDAGSSNYSHESDGNLSDHYHTSDTNSSVQSVMSDEKSIEHDHEIEGQSGGSLNFRESLELENATFHPRNTNNEQNDNKSSQSMSNATFNDATTLPMSNHIGGSNAHEVDPASEFDDETRSSKTRHKNTPSILMNDDHTSEHDSPQNLTKTASKKPQQLGEYFAAQYPVVEVDMIDQSIASGLTFGDNYGGPSPNCVQDISISNHKMSKKEKQSSFPQLKDIPEEEKSYRRSHINNTPQSSWPTLIPNINQEKKRSVIGRNQWCSSRIHKLFCQKGAMNNICADCSIPLQYADSIYASFYFDPDAPKQKKRSKSKKLSQDKKRSYHRYTSSMEEIIDVLDSDSSSSDVEFFESVKTRPKSLLEMNQISSLSMAFDDNDVPPSRSEKMGLASNLSSNVSLSSSRSQPYLIDTNDENDIEGKQESPSKRKKNLINHRMYHLANFKSLHSYYGVTGFSSKHSQRTKGNPISPSHKHTPRRAFIQCHGVFVCKDCAFAHNMLGRSITTVKSVYATTQWSEDEIYAMEQSGGNIHAKLILQRHLPDRLRDIFTLHDRSTREERVMFVRAKYDLWAFMFPKGPLHRMSRWETLLESDLSTKSKRKKCQTYMLPDRLVDYFCVVGATRSIKKSLKTSPKESFNSSINIELQPKVWDCYPIPQNSHSDMPLPNFLPNYAFPNGCRPSSKKRVPHFFTFVLTLEHTNAKVYGSVLTVYEDIVYMNQILDCLHNEGFVKPDNFPSEEQLLPKPTKEERQKLFLPKALIILSHYPLVNLHRTFLQQIYLLSHTKSTPLPIERYISNFCSDIPLPPQGQVTMNFGYFDDSEGLNVHFCRPSKNNLPLVGSSYRPLFTSLSVSNILVVFGCLVHEMKVVLCSKYIALLTPVAEALRSALYPFVWQGLYIPVLPYSMIDLLQSPQPFFVGTHSRYLVEVDKKDRPNGVVFVDLDKDIVHLGFEEGETASVERKTPNLPEKEVEKLKNKLDQFGGLAYLPPSGGQQGRLTSGRGLGTILNLHREKYAYQTSLAMGNEKKKVSPRDSIGSLRTGILAKIDEAYVNDEHLKGVYFPETTLGTGAKLVSEKSHTKKNLKRGVKEDVKRRSLLDSNLDEKGGFSTCEIRQAFVRFFAVIFRNYDRFLLNDLDRDGYEKNDLSLLFDSTNFLKKVSSSNDYALNFATSFIKTQMFEEFIRERQGNPKLPEILYFDETIIVRKNLSKKNKLKGGLKKTPFLSDKSDWVSERFHETIKIICLTKYPNKLYWLFL